jgi:hypothetical protein
MPRIHSPDSADCTRSAEEEFLDLLLADDDLLRAEFDAIIAAEWPEPPADRPGSSVAGRPPGGGPSRRAADPVRGPVSRPRHPGIGGWARQRSPPVRHPTHDRQEGR